MPISEKSFENEWKGNSLRNRGSLITKDESTGLALHCGDSRAEQENSFWMVKWSPQICRILYMLLFCFFIHTEPTYHTLLSTHTRVSMCTHMCTQAHMHKPDSSNWQQATDYFEAMVPQPLTEDFFCIRHCPKHITDACSFNIHNNPMI